MVWNCGQEINNRRKYYKYVETKHYTCEQPMNWRTKEGNQNVSWDKQKWKHMYQNLWDAVKTKLRALNTHINTKERSQVTYLTPQEIT